MVKYGNEISALLTTQPQGPPDGFRVFSINLHKYQRDVCKEFAKVVRLLSIFHVVVLLDSSN